MEMNNYVHQKFEVTLNVKKETISMCMQEYISSRS